jgi:alanine racemase
MVRLGIGVYGVSNDPAEQKYLENVELWNQWFPKLELLLLGECGIWSKIYGWETTKVIPIGYADGISRGWEMGLDLSP